MKKKLAILGASYLQDPLIQKAKAMGIETHVFAWQCGEIGEKSADFFYPISIVEKEAVLEQCRQIGIDGICSIASDLAAITVNYVASVLCLNGNSIACTEKSTNKYRMRCAFEQHGDPSPKSLLVEDVSDLDGTAFSYPVIVKPVDRSGSRGITKVTEAKGLSEAINVAKNFAFIKKALVEEYVSGQEYSVECISYQGKHTFLALTQKYTSGAPHFIEAGHMEPARVSEDLLDRIKRVIFHALDSLEITNSASHSEIKISPQGEIKLIEINGRMGGDFIGSHLVELSTGIDFVQAVIEVALGVAPDLTPKHDGKVAAVRYVFNLDDYNAIAAMKNEIPEQVRYDDTTDKIGAAVTDSTNRHGACVFVAERYEDIASYMPSCGDNKIK